MVENAAVFCYLWLILPRNLTLNRYLIHRIRMDWTQNVANLDTIDANHFAKIGDFFRFGSISRAFCRFENQIQQNEVPYIEARRAAR